jgi:hypothetical protein
LTGYNRTRVGWVVRSRSRNRDLGTRRWREDSGQVSVVSCQKSFMVGFVLLQVLSAAAGLAVVWAYTGKEVDPAYEQRLFQLYIT